MYLRLITNEIRKNKVINITTLLFVASSALLMSLAIMLMFHLSGAIEHLLVQTQAPHFLQMHQGTLNQKRLDQFASKNEYIDAYQVLEFLNIEGNKIQLGEKSLADSVQDNGFSIQSKKFDYLLDLEGNIIEPEEGALYVPLCYMKEGLTKVGDKAIIAGQSFTVAGFLRDGQMNSDLASSKRFLVHEKDYEKLRQLGNVEYLIEFRLKDLSKAGAFEVDYNAAGLEANGPTITSGLFKLINAMTDGLMIAVIVLVSILVVLVALMCIRFTLLAQIEEDYQQIGILKAIGIRVKDIKKIYLAKYGVIAAMGCLLGSFLSFLFRGSLMMHIKLYFGESESGIGDYAIGVIGALAIFLTIMAYVSGVLRRLKKLAPADAIRFGVAQEKQKSTKHFKLVHKKILSTNIFMGIKDILYRTKLYVTMLLVIMIATFILIVPRNLYHTIASEAFSGYMGVGLCDLRMDIQQVDHLEEKTADIIKALEQDSDVTKYIVLTSKSFEVIMPDGTKERIKVELGNHQAFPVFYAVGQAPRLENEIALSGLNASALEKKVGDSVDLVVDGKEKAFKVCGIYSDFTNGGKSAKATFNAPETETMWNIIYINLRERTLRQAKQALFKTQFGYDKIASINEYISKVFGGTLSAVQKASGVTMMIALLISFLITILFIKMLIIKDRPTIATLKALGFKCKDIDKQYMTRSGCILIVAVILGIILSNTLGEVLAGTLLASLGAVSFKLMVAPVETYLLCPILLASAVIGATLIATSEIKQVRISENIKE